MTLTVKNKEFQKTKPITGSLRCNIFSWKDGFYNIELQKYNGINWIKEGNSKCVTEKELEELTRDMVSRGIQIKTLF